MRVAMHVYFGGFEQAAGSALSRALADWRACPCGWLGPAIWFISVAWLLCVPAGFLVFLIVRFVRARRAGAIRFRRQEGGGSWSAYLRRIRAARGSPDEACHPRTVHSAAKVSLGVGAAVSHLMGLKSLSGGEYVLAIALLATGSCLGLAATMGLKSRLGRRTVVSLSSMLGASRGRGFALDDADAGGAVREFQVDPKRISWVRRTCTGAILVVVGTVQASWNTDKS